MSGSWRYVARPIIYRVLEDNRGRSEKEIRAALRAAYPFGQREHWPYKVWLDEIAIQMGKKLKRCPRNPVTPAHPCPGQRELFQEAAV